MIRIADIITAIERVAPPGLQESYDNTGLQIGNKDAECTGVLICVDATPKIVKEAADKGCNLIVSHHPLFFKGIKRLTGSTLVERTAIDAIAQGIAIYSGHTSVDSFSGGISIRMAEMLGLHDIRVLEPRKNDVLKLTVWIPAEHSDSLLAALFETGCGSMGNYDQCSFRSAGVSTFRPLEGSAPFAGIIDQKHSCPEDKIELTLYRWMREKAESVIQQLHPYEEPAFEFTEVTVGSMPNGLGAVGKFNHPTTDGRLVERVKDVFGSPVARCTAISGIDIDTVALCGGSGSSLIGNAIKSGAQAFITSDTRYHDFVDYADKILIIDIGHYESEGCAKNIFHDIITKNFHNFAVHYSQSETNPIIYR